MYARSWRRSTVAEPENAHSRLFGCARFCFAASPSAKSFTQGRLLALSCRTSPRSPASCIITPHASRKRATVGHFLHEQHMHLHMHMQLSCCSAYEDGAGCLLELLLAPLCFDCCGLLNETVTCRGFWWIVMCHDVKVKCVGKHNSYVERQCLQSSISKIDCCRIPRLPLPLPRPLCVAGGRSSSLLASTSMSALPSLLGPAEDGRGDGSTVRWPLACASSACREQV